MKAKNKTKSRLPIAKFERAEGAARAKGRLSRRWLKRRVKGKSKVQGSKSKVPSGNGVSLIAMIDRMYP